MTYTLDPDATITAPGGFRVTGIHCGLKATTRERDLGLLIARESCAAAAHFGGASGPAGAWSTAALRRNNQDIRAVIMLAGIAGERGAAAIAAFDELASFFADEAWLKPEQVLIAAAGAEGALPTESVHAGLRRGLDELDTAAGRRLALALALDGEEPRQAAVTVALPKGASSVIAGLVSGQRLVVTTNAQLGPKELEVAIGELLTHYPELDEGSVLVLALSKGQALTTKPALKAWQEGLSGLVGHLRGAAAP